MSAARTREPGLLLAPVVVLLVGAFVVPVVGMLVQSLSVDGQFGMGNFTSYFESSYHVKATLRSLRLAVWQTTATVGLAIPLSLVMARASRRLRTVLLILVVLPLMTSVVVRTFGWVVLLGPVGLLGSVLDVSWLGGRGQGLLGTETGIVIAMVQVLLPFAVLTILGVVNRIPRDLSEAARTMGASYWTTLRTVVLPLAGPGIAAGAALVFALSVSSFITPGLIGGRQLPVLASTIYTDATINLDWPFASAQAVILLVGVLMAFAATSRLDRSGS